MLCLPEGRCHDFLFVHREQMESQLEKEARFRQLMAHSSHDSAIDTDSMEWETEVVEFERETVNCPQVFFSSALLNMQAWDGGERVAGPPAVPSSFTAASWEVSFSSQGADASFAGTCPSQVAAAAWPPVSPSRCWQCVESRARGAVCLQWQRGVDHSCSELSSWGPSAPSE